MRAGELVTKGSDAPLKSEPEGSDAPLKSGSSPTSQFSMVEMRYGKEGLKIKLPSLSGWLLKKHAGRAPRRRAVGRRHFVVDDTLDATTPRTRRRAGRTGDARARRDRARARAGGRGGACKWSRHHDADGALSEVVAGGRLVLRAEDREERTMGKGCSAGSPSGAAARRAIRRGARSPRTGTAKDRPPTVDGVGRRLDDHVGVARERAAARPTRPARYEEEDDAARQQDEHGCRR